MRSGGSEHAFSHFSTGFFNAVGICKFVRALVRREQVVGMGKMTDFSYVRPTMDLQVLGLGSLLFSGRLGGQMLLERDVCMSV